MLFIHEIIMQRKLPNKKFNNIPINSADLTSWFVLYLEMIYFIRHAESQYNAAEKEIEKQVG